MGMTLTLCGAAANQLGGGVTVYPFFGAGFFGLEDGVGGRFFGEGMFEYF